MTDDVIINQSLDRCSLTNHHHIATVTGTISQFDSCRFSPADSVQIQSIDLLRNNIECIWFGNKKCIFIFSTFEQFLFCQTMRHCHTDMFICQWFRSIFQRMKNIVHIPASGRFHFYNVLTWAQNHLRNQRQCLCLPLGVRFHL